MRRREFLRVIGGAAAWPVAAHAQQRGRMPLVLVWLGGRADDPETQRRHNVFRDAMYELGWIDGRTVRLEYRATADAEQHRTMATELAAPHGFVSPAQGLSEADQDASPRLLALASPARTRS